MKQIGNGYCDYYFLTETGEVYNKEKDKYIRANKDHKFRLKRLDNTYKSISLKPLYKLVYGKLYCNDNVTDLEDEQWIAIDSTDQVYLVSNKGRVKSLSGYEAIILKPTITKNGYERLDIIQEGKRSTKLVHCLVAAAFLPVPDQIEGIQIHHKDFNKLNNRADNLQYLSSQQHTKIHMERRKKESVSTKPEDNIYQEIE